MRPGRGPGRKNEPSFACSDGAMRLPMLINISCTASTSCWTLIGECMYTSNSMMDFTAAIAYLSGGGGR